MTSISFKHIFAPSLSEQDSGLVVVIDDDSDLLEALQALLHAHGLICLTFADANAYIDQAIHLNRAFPGPSCLLCDVQMPGLSGLDLQSQLPASARRPMILMSGASSNAEVVSAFRGGAFDFILKPFDSAQLLAVIDEALASSAKALITADENQAIQQKIATLTVRERQVLKAVAAGLLNREIAEQLGVGIRTVKLHRQHGMEKLGVSKLVDFTALLAQTDL